MYIETLRKKEYFSSINPGDKIKIEEIRTYLKNRLPLSFLGYLNEVGHGGIPTFDIIGTGIPENEYAALVYANKNIHNLDNHLPEEYVLIMDIGDEVSWFLDISSFNEVARECPVVGWISGLSVKEQPKWVKEEETFETFEEFFYAKVIKRIE